MAWTDQCKIAFKTSADALLWMKKGRKGIMVILKELSKQSGIPYKTLYRWWNEMEKDKEKSLKNETNGEGAESVEEIDDKPSSISSIPICDHCNKNNVYLDNYSKKPLSENSIYYGLCGTCKSRKEKIRNPNRPNHKPIIQNQIVCPECNHMFFINNKEVQNE